MGWARIQSWHRVLTFTRDGGLLTVCGRRVPPPINETWESDSLPAGRSCESCLRILARQRDRDDREAAQGSGLD